MLFFDDDYDGGRAMVFFLEAMVVLLFNGDEDNGGRTMVIFFGGNSGVIFR